MQSTSMQSTHDAMELCGALSAAMRRALPSMHGITRDAVNLYKRDNFVGRGSTFEIIPGIAAVSVDVTIIGADIQFCLNGKEQVRKLLLVEDLRAASSIREVQADFIAQTIQEMVLPVLVQRWEPLRRQIVSFGNVAPEAAAFADFFNERLVFEHNTATVGMKGWAFGGSGNITWMADRPPVDQETCWSLQTYPRPQLGVVRVETSPYDSKVGRKVFRLMWLSDNVTFDGSLLLLPEQDPPQPLAGGIGGYIIPRSQAADLVVRVLAQTMSALDNEKARVKVVEQAFGNIIKSAGTEMTKAAEQMEKTTARLDGLTARLENLAADPLEGFPPREFIKPKD